MPSNTLRTTIALRNLNKAVAIASLAVSASIATPAPTQADERDNDRGVVRVMTQNMDEGTDFQELNGVQTPQQFFAAVSTIYQNILATKPAERAAAMAREIAEHRPDLVALQEASVLRTGSGGPAITVRMDLLQSLLDELAGLGQHYTAVAIIPGFDAQVPSTLGFDVRITTQDAILVRTDPLSDNLKVSNLQIEQFVVKFTAPTFIGTLIDPRGWAAIDVNAGGKSFRFVTTHLDSTHPAIRLAQASEMIRSAGNTSLPVIIAGDFNATADTSLDPSYPTYQAMLNAGFTDAWQSKRAGDPGFTCCQAPDLLNATSLLNHRIDLVMLRGAFQETEISLIGNQPADRTPSGLWPSDHAGVAATLRLSARQAANP